MEELKVEEGQPPCSTFLYSPLLADTLLGELAGREAAAEPCPFCWLCSRHLRDHHGRGQEEAEDERCCRLGLELHPLHRNLSVYSCLK